MPGSKGDTQPPTMTGVAFATAKVLSCCAGFFVVVFSPQSCQCHQLRQGVRVDRFSMGGTVGLEAGKSPTVTFSMSFKRDRSVF